MDAEAEAPVLWPHVAKSQLIRKDLDTGKTEGKRINAFKFWLRRRLESPLECKEIKPINP